MAPSSTAKPKKEKVFHPSSRKAGQLARNALRKGKLGNLSAKRSQKHHSLGLLNFDFSSFSMFLTRLLSLVDLYGFFYHAMPEEGVMSLQDLHHIISDIWLTRFDEDLEKERSARRKGRPKSLKEIKLEELKLREAELYRTGMGMRPPLEIVSPEN
jgi:translation machinery-associated protein 16